jgi:hypothetical protein
VDLYVLLIASAVVAVLSLLDIASQEAVLTVLLGLLALLSVALLVFREQTDSLGQALDALHSEGSRASDFFTDENLPGLLAAVGSARTV